METSLCYIGLVSVLKLPGTNMIIASKCKFPDISLTFLSLPQESNNEVGAAGPSGDFEIRDDRRNDLGRGVVSVDTDLIGNTVDGGSSAAQLPQKNILERKEVLIGKTI